MAIPHFSIVTKAVVNFVLPILYQKIIFAIVIVIVAMTKIMIMPVKCF